MSLKGFMFMSLSVSGIESALVCEIISRCVYQCLSSGFKISKWVACFAVFSSFKQGLYG